MTKVGICGPGKNVRLTKTVLVFKGFTVVLNILLSKCLNPIFKNNFLSMSAIRSDKVNWRAFLLKNGFPSETNSGPT